ncbi:MAG: hypothetical protein V2B18_20790 [Pseudomonadota bacterium]
MSRFSAILCALALLMPAGVIHAGPPGVWTDRTVPVDQSDGMAVFGHGHGLILAHDRPLVCYCCCSVPGGQRCVDKTVAECLGQGCKCYGQYK